jgi:E2F/DP family winged-helix DNA-binding domain
VNIFEAVRLVVKKGKNTYNWMGTDHLPHMFALLQQEAIFDYPQDAVKGEIIDTLPTPEQINVARLAFRDPKRDAKSLSRLSQQFLQVFLVHNIGTCVSLIDASDKIHGGSSTQHELASLGLQGRALPDDPVLIQKAAARGLKTKIRRLYDIANVFHAIGLLEKVDETEHKLICGDTLEGRRPFYRYVHSLQPCVSCTAS